MKRILSAAEMRAVDAESDLLGISSLKLMESAGEALAHVAIREAGKGGRFFVICGPGNNGGDGFVATGILSALGRQVYCELVGEEPMLKGDARINYDALLETGFVLSERIPYVPGPNDVIVDALLGTGLNKPVKSEMAEAISNINEWRKRGAKVVSADIASGLNADTGQLSDPSVRADVTVSFAFPKRGQVIEPGVSFGGRLEVPDIGIPPVALAVLKDPPVFLVDENDIKALIPKRDANTNKGTFGHVLVIAGSPGKTGAAALSAKAALRGGAGLVTVCTRADALPQVMQHAPELMGIALKNSGAMSVRDLNELLEAAEKKSAIVFGPGIDRTDDTHRMIGAFLEEVSCPVVIDADGLNAIVDHLSVLSRAKSDLILTPHPGEFARLIGKPTAEVQANRIELARTFARTHQVVLVLKGARTIIARPDGTVTINPTGNAGMATGGTGDVLSGLLGALLAQHLSSEDAAVAGTYVHGLAGDLMKERHGEMGLIASDLIDGLSEVWKRWGR